MIVAVHRLLLTAHRLPFHASGDDFFTIKPNFRHGSCTGSLSESELWERARVSKKQATRPVPAFEQDMADTMSPEEFVTPALARIFLGSQQSRTRLVLWGLTALLLLFTLLGQSLYFYGSELARQPRLGPWVTAACQHLGCVVRPRQDRLVLMPQCPPTSSSIRLGSWASTPLNSASSVLRTYLPS